MFKNLAEGRFIDKDNEWPFKPSMAPVTSRGRAKGGTHKVTWIYQAHPLSQLKSRPSGKGMYRRWINKP